MMLEWIEMLENREELRTKYKKLAAGVGCIMCGRTINVADAAQIAVCAWT